MNCFPARGIGLVLVAASAACASSGAGSESQEFDPSLPIACVDIDNRQGSGTLERVYLVQVERRRSGRQGEGVRIGDAPVGRVTRFCTQNIQLPGRYFIRVEQAPADNFDPANQNQETVGSFSSRRNARTAESQDVLVEPGDLWIWEVRRDRWTCTENGAVGGDC